MAYPTISAPYGLKPYNLLGGRVYSGSTRMLPISTGFSSNLFYGDVVGFSGGSLNTTGYTASFAGTAGYGLGIFQGAEYSTSSSVGGAGPGPIYGKNRYQYWLASTNAQDAQGYVVDDPQALFRVAVLTQAAVAAAANISVAFTATSTIGYMSPAFVGTNAYLCPGAGGNTSTGDSSMGITGCNPVGSASSVAGNLRNTGVSAPFRIVQLVPDTAVTVNTITASAISSGSFTVASTTGIYPGMQCIILGYTGALPGQFAYVQTVVASTNTVVVQTAASGQTGATAATNTGITCSAPSGTAVAFVGYPEVVVGWNYDYHYTSIGAGA